MFKEEVYTKISSEFGVSIGVASSIKSIDMDNDKVKNGNLSKKDISLVEKQFKEYRNQIQLHGIINRAIRMGRYKELMRVVLCDKTPNRSELTRYRTAWRSITGSPPPPKSSKRITRTPRPLTQTL